MPSREATRVSSSLVWLCFYAEGKLRSSADAKHSMWAPLRIACALVFFDAEQARRHRTRRLAAAAVVHAVPEADVSHLVPRERRFDPSAFACSAWPRSSPLVLNTPSAAPLETSSLACAWVVTADLSESQHPALSRIPCCKNYTGSSQVWRTQVIRETQRPSSSACGCTRLLCVRLASQWHRRMLWPLSAWRWSCSVRCTWWVQPTDLPAVVAADLHAFCT